MKLAFGVVKHDGVVAFGCLVVAGFDLCSNGTFSQRYFVCFDDFIAMTKMHLSLRFFY